MSKIKIRCPSCVYYDDSRSYPSTTYREGLCRYIPPQTHGLWGQTSWPRVTQDDWCSSYQSSDCNGSNMWEDYYGVSINE